MSPEIGSEFRRGTLRFKLSTMKRYFFFKGGGQNVAFYFDVNCLGSLLSCVKTQKFN